MVSLASSSSRSGAPALVAGSAGAAKRLGGLTVRSRPPLHPAPRPPRRRACRAGASGTRDPCPRRVGKAAASVRDARSPWSRPAQGAPGPASRHRARGRRPRGRQARRVGDRGSGFSAAGRTWLDPRGPGRLQTRGGAGPRSGGGVGAQRGSRRGGGPGRGAAHSPTATRRRGHSPVRPAAQSRGGG